MTSFFYFCKSVNPILPLNPHGYILYMHRLSKVNYITLFHQISQSLVSTLYLHPTELTTYNPTQSNTDHEIKPLSFQQYLKAISSTGFYD